MRLSSFFYTSLHPGYLQAFGQGQPQYHGETRILLPQNASF